MSNLVTERLQTEIVTLAPDTEAAEVLQSGAAKGARHFLVIDQGSLVGVVSRRVLKAVAGDVDSASVGDVMTSPVICIGPETTEAEALQIMTENGVSFLPIVIGGFIVGYVNDSMLAVPAEAPAQAGAGGYVN